MHMTRSALRKQEPRAAASGAAPHYRLSDYPMHYLAAIQRQNQLNLGHALRPAGLSVPMWRALSALHFQRLCRSNGGWLR